MLYLGREIEREKRSGKTGRNPSEYRKDRHLKKEGRKEVAFGGMLASVLKGEEERKKTRGGKEGILLFWQELKCV